MANIKISGSPYPIALNQSTTPNGTEIVPADSVVSGIRNTYGFTFASLLGSVALNYSTGQVTVNQKTGLTRGLSVLAPNTSSFASLSVVGGNGASGTNDVFLYQDSSSNGYVGTSGAYPFNLQTNSTNRLQVTSNGALIVNVPTTSTALTVYGAQSYYTLTAQASLTTSLSFGQLVQAGTNSSDYAVNVVNSAATKGLLFVRGDGLVQASTNSIASAVAPSTAWHFDWTGNGGQTNEVTLANNATLQIPSGSGLVYIYTISPYAAMGYVFLCFGGTYVTNVFNAILSSAAGTSGKINIYYSAPYYYIQNLYGSAMTMAVSTLRLRSSV